MSRNQPPNAAAQRAAANQVEIKKLLKVETNKICADCKRNKHPRWASWNLGVFVCIRCSGIHRGMGTHISRVKSVDLDAWTDEQLASIVRWGNARANTYWEAKLAPGHVPSDSKIENFIRTKYESKRWVMDGPMPDPSTLGASADDDDVPLNVVQERAKAERSSGHVSSTARQPVAPPPKAAPQLDLFGDVPEPPARPNTTDTPGALTSPPQKPAPPKQQKAADSLLGLDFFGGPQGPPGRPSSSSSTPAVASGPSRPDLKQSILSLYAAKPQPTSQHDRQPSFGGMQSPPPQQGGGLGGLDDAFANLNFNPQASQPAPAAPKADPFASMTSFSKPSAQRSSAAPPQVTSPLSGGGFFDAGPKQPSMPSTASKPPQKPQANLAPTSSTDFGDFSFASSTPAPPPKPAPPSTSMDLFDFAEPSAQAPPLQQEAQPSAPVPAPKDLGDFSAFNLSKPAPPQPISKPVATTQPTTSKNLSNFSDSDAWGSNDAWSTPEPAATSAPAPKLAAPAKQPSIPMSSDFSAWGGSTPSNNQSSGLDVGWGAPSQPARKVAQDEDFGGWSSAAPETPVASNPAPSHPQPKPAAGGFGGGGDDLFSNVWG